MGWRDYQIATVEEETEINPDALLRDMLADMDRRHWPEDLFTLPGVPLEKLRTAENQIDHCHMARDFQGLQLAVATYKSILMDARAKFGI